MNCHLLQRLDATGSKHTLQVCIWIKYWNPMFPLHKYPQEQMFISVRVYRQTTKDMQLIKYSEITHWKKIIIFYKRRKTLYMKDWSHFVLFWFVCYCKLVMWSICFWAVQCKWIFVVQSKNSRKYSTAKNSLKDTAMLNLELSKWKFLPMCPCLRDKDFVYISIH